MRKTVRTGRLVACVLLAACTPGGVATSGGGGGATSAVIDINLTNSIPARVPQGNAGAYMPLVTHIAVGSTVRFTNTDGFTHTATLIPGNPPTFPSAYPFTSTALNQTGSDLSDGWSSGALPAGSSSQTLTANIAGSYVFGCFFHYGAPMRGVIVVQ
jgi:plastocyanin